MKILYTGSTLENSLEIHQIFANQGHLVFQVWGHLLTREHLKSLDPDLVVCELSADSEGLPRWLSELENTAVGERPRIFIVGDGLSVPTTWSPHISFFLSTDPIALTRSIDDLASSIDTEIPEESSRSLSRWQELVGSDEAIRRQVAKELHGETGQYLTVVSLQLQALRRNLSDPEKSLAKVNETLKLLDDACRQLRSLTTKAWPSVLDDLGLAPALRSWASRVERERGLKVTLQVPDADQRIGSPWEVVLYRVVEDTIETIAESSQTCIIKIDFCDPPCRARLSIQCLFPDPCGSDHGNDCAGPRDFETVKSRVLLYGGEFSMSIEPEGIEIVVSFSECGDREQKDKEVRDEPDESVARG